jgi:3-hydroxyisobutyrate dehydrogenase
LIRCAILHSFHCQEDYVMPTTAVGFIGLGNMGQAMAMRLLATGHTVRVYNRTPQRADALVRQGAVRCDSPRDACRGVDAVISMVADDAASRAVWLATDGILAAPPAERAFAIECSTLSHEWVGELAARCRARGLRYIDAPVTGLPDAAANGALTLLVGAAADDLRAGHGILAALSERIIRFGEVGAGTAYKLIINLMGAVQIASAAEGLAIAERAGLDLATVADAIGTSQAASPQVVRNTRRMVAADHQDPVVFSAALRLKDVDYALRLASSLGMASPFGAVAEQAYRRLCEMGYARLNESKVIDACRTYCRS